MYFPELAIAILLVLLKVLYAIQQPELANASLMLKASDVIGIAYDIFNIPLSLLSFDSNYVSIFELMQSTIRNICIAASNVLHYWRDVVS